MFLPMFPLFAGPPSALLELEDVGIPADGAPSEPRDLRITETGNLWIAGGDLWLVGGIPAIVQECGTALRLWLGEYLLDDLAGAQWQTVLTKGVSDQELDAEIRRVLQTVPGVVGVDNVAIVRDTLSRRATITASVTANGGVVLTVAQELET